MILNFHLQNHPSDEGISTPTPSESEKESHKASVTDYTERYKRHVGRVLDETEILSPEEKSKIKTDLGDHTSRYIASLFTSSQVQEFQNLSNYQQDLQANYGISIPE